MKTGNQTEKTLTNLVPPPMRKTAVWLSTIMLDDDLSPTRVHKENAVLKGEVQGW